MPDRTIRRAAALILFAPSALVAAAAGCATPSRIAREPAPGEAVLRVLTYNVNYGLAGDPAGIDAIRDAGADLVVLQETTPAWEDALRGALAADYPHIAFHHGSGAGGLGILSRTPFDADAPTSPPDGGWFPAWRIELSASPIGRVQVLAVHLRPPLSDSGGVVSGHISTPSIREREIESHALTLEPDVATLIVGDFNESEGRALAWLGERGFRSVLPEHDPGKRTWRWQTSVGEITSTLDHIAYDAHLEPTEARVLERGRSDHLPILATFTRPR